MTPEQRQQIDAYIATIPADIRRKIEDQLFSYQAFKDLYRDNAVGFVEQCVDWNRIKDRPTTYQLDVLDRLTKKGKVAVRGPRGMGKTFIAALACNWFPLTRDGDIAHNWKLVTTAGSSVQLNSFLWPSIRMIARLLRWNMIGRAPYKEGVEMLQQAINLSSGLATSISPREPEKVEGAHAHSIFYLYDEAKSIIDGIYDSSEGAFSGAGPDTGREAFALAISTPGEPTGRFYAIHTRKPGFEDWEVVHVTLAQTIAAKRVSQEWADRVKRQWGENSQLYQNHVLGEFATGSTNSVIPLAWLEAAHERWLALQKEGKLPAPRTFTEQEREIVSRIKETYDRHGAPITEDLLTSIGVDCAYGGDDKITLAERYDNVILSLAGISVHRDAQPTVVTASRVIQIRNMRGGMPIVDVIGVGGGVVDQLRLHEHPVLPFIAGASAEKDGIKLMDRSRALRFQNMRSAAWWNLRDLLDPANGYNIAIPPDETQLALVESEGSLTQELLAPRWWPDGERIVVESKDELRKPDRLGHSTDWADAVVQAFALNIISNYRQPDDIGMS